ncbi:Ctr copper transporter family-domain-containing protein [Amanita rubescens]|nr:Ctr copper transporter family-domain-containing protein [Amanita rubescens]
MAASTLTVLLTILLPFVCAQGMSGMGMDTGFGSNSSTMMTSFLHFTPLGDTLWFQGWAPKSPGAMVGACIGLFLLAIFDRWLAAGRAMAEMSWRESAQLAAIARLDLSKESTNQKPGPADRSPILRALSLRSGPYAPPFIPSQNLARGALHTVQTALLYVFMLAVMTFQVGFIISICLGAGVGEIMFGRFIASASTAH